MAVLSAARLACLP
ncbi:hypothetical protein CGLO_17891 [Colletotrichum gloeosporioides Cg-14]|uniref:Uncharacterized protein n=1 Tax=Colletotrichum gloeosporioides (strain Cg-14) TaxID=1237896 RepID=T0KVY0_COLGC|nr:hypothetical protein CGLO_17891 [Colletotrichum gloeosporioides Cg-14]